LRRGAEADYARGCYGVSESLRSQLGEFWLGNTYGCSSGPDTVEHVCAESDGYYEIFGVSYAHDISGFVVWQ
jgi:hypothetical protein